ncbi:hypothetical protein ATE67_00245 [Sphingopyxis sp. H050]|jgi:hypothetical protein|uniref:hypothetical protein n=1 Tax=Sphingopyxis sp. H050 TaxID=1759072 RepID=UPI000736671F|nr:hypothetical protein [Sphingopyxis sp. H050]KTE22422.1 hypothetical protein ATE67_00245 [Sphingopyxis sp. H050]
MLTMTTAALALMMQGAPAPACTLGRIAGDPREKRIWASLAPSPGARKIAKVKPGQRILLCGRKREWILIRFADRRHSCGGIGGRPAGAGSTCAEAWIERRRIISDR